jgi:hypothetical protein
LRRIVLIATGVIALVAAGTAYAALNTYTAKTTFASKKAGTPAKPVPMGFTQQLTATGINGNRTAVLLDLKTTTYGLKANLKPFLSKKCTGATIANAKNDTICPKSALVASGYIHAAVGPKTDFTPTATGVFPCDPALDVWATGPSQVTFFFVDTPAHNCNALGLKTGSTPPYPGTISYKGKDMVLNVPIPPAISFPAPGFAGSLQLEHLVWTHQSTKVGGKAVSVMTSIGCKGGKRPWTQAFTATLPTQGPAKETKSVSGSSPCSK